MSKPPPEPSDVVAHGNEDGDSAAEGTVSELDVQREVVVEMAREKAELEELRASLEGEKQALEVEKAALETEKQELIASKVALEVANRELESGKLALEERISALEAEISDLKGDVESARDLNAVLEAKVTCLGKALIAARRAAVEAAKVEIGGRRW